jgi:hypothetical protein
MLHLNKNIFKYNVPFSLKNGIKLCELKGGAMNKHDLAKVYKAGEKAGFNLEYRALEVFEEKFSKHANNLSINHVVNDGRLALDLCAKISSLCRTTHHYLVECKGTDPDNFLLLVESQIVDGSYKPGYSLPSIKIDTANNSLLHDNNANFCVGHQGTSPVSVFTGNFFDGKKYTRTTPSDDKNNLFKAILQLQEACKHYPRSLDPKGNSEYPDFIIPVVVTNATIYVQNYPNKEICSPPWVVYRSEKNVEDVDMPYAFIVNIDSLGDFLSSNAGYQYDKETQWFQ